MSTRVIAVSMQKGGVAKTTTTVNLAGALAEQGRRVLVIDLDSQSSASRWIGQANSGQPMLDIYEDEASLPDLIRESQVNGIDLAASGPKLIESALAAIPDAVNALSPAIETIRSRYDYILLDCPPSLGVASISALVAADSVLVPLEASALSADALPRLIKTIGTIKKRHDLDILGVLICRVNPRTLVTRQLHKVLERQFGDKLFDTMIRESVRLREAPARHETILTYDSRGHGAADYRALATEVLERCG